MALPALMAILAALQTAQTAAKGNPPGMAPSGVQPLQAPPPSTPQPGVPGGMGHDQKFRLGIDDQNPGVTPGVMPGIAQGVEAAVPPTNFAKEMEAANTNKPSGMGVMDKIGMGAEIGGALQSALKPPSVRPINFGGNASMRAPEQSTPAPGKRAPQQGFMEFLRRALGR